MTADKYGPDLERHEAVHSSSGRIWDAVSFPTDYAAQSLRSQQETGTPWATNSYEVDANLWWGGYLDWHPLQYGPIP